MSTSKAQRFFALSGALLFLFTTVGLSGLVIWQVHNQSKQDPNANKQKTDTCSISSASGQASAVPTAFKPDGAITTLQSIDLKTGSGAVAKNGDCLQVKYVGSLAKDGTVFDENFDKAASLKFRLGTGTVIPGWDQGMVGMKVGGERRLLIPSALGYGSTGNESIPPNSDIVFEVQLLGISQ